MNKTFFHLNSTWIEIKRDSEVELLKSLLLKYDYDGHLTIIDNYMVVTKPEPFYGENYKKWEKIKREIYTSRRA